MARRPLRSHRPPVRGRVGGGVGRRYEPLHVRESPCFPLMNILNKLGVHSRLQALLLPRPHRAALDEQIPLADVLRRSGHVDGLSVPGPLYLDHAAVQRHAHRTPYETSPYRRHRCPARARPRGQSLPRAALPDPHPHLVLAPDVDELHVRPLGEKGIVLDWRTHLCEIQRPDLFLAFEERNGVGVAHRNAQKNETVELDLRTEPRRAHVYAGGVVAKQHDLLHADPGLHGKGLTFYEPAVPGVAGEAADAVAAHLGRRAVGVEVDHLQVRNLRVGRDQYPVRPDAEVPVTRSAGEIREVQPRDLLRSEDDKVVADAVHLGETHVWLTFGSMPQLSYSLPSGYFTAFSSRSS